jgi:hypothetical protein
VHANHPDSEELTTTYVGEKKYVTLLMNHIGKTDDQIGLYFRHLDPAALLCITDAKRDGAIPFKVGKRVYDEFNAQVTHVVGPISDHVGICT